MDVLIWFIKFSIKNTSGCAVKSKTMSNQQLAEEFQKPVIRKFKKRKVHSSFIDNIWGAYLPNMQLIGKFDKGFRFLVCIIDICGRYARKF